MNCLKSYLPIGALFCLASSLVAVNAGRAATATATGSLAVSGSVGASCSVGASSLNFGALTSLVALNGSGSITVTCTSGAAYSVDLDLGTHFSSNLGGRQLANGANFVLYDLFQDAGHTILFGTAVTGPLKAGTGTGAAQSIPVYGNIESGQVATPGTYTDTVGITVTF